MLHAVEAPVAQNAKVFESGDNFHLQPAAIWSKAHTKQKWRRADNLLKSLYFEDWIKVVKIELCLMKIKCQFISVLSKEKFLSN